MTKVRTGRRYRAHRLAPHYDVIVIGSGIGGLVNAALLSLMGKRVCVLEQHYTAGGYTHAYEREGFEWDVGVHYIGDVHRPESRLRRIFDVVSEGRLQWAPMDSVYDRIVLGQREYDFRAGTENFITELLWHFPTEEKAIRRYVSLLRETSYKSSQFFAGQAMPKPVATLYNKTRGRLLGRQFQQTTRDVLEGLTGNQELIAVLTGQWGDYGLPPAESSFLMHALVAKHYLAGGAYPVGGASAIARSIIPTIQASGGEVFTYAEVTDILLERRKAVGVRMADGHEIRATSVVSNAGILPTVNQLLPPELRPAFKLDRGVELSSAHLCLYAGFNGSPETLGMKTTNLWLYPNSDHEGNLRRYLDDPDHQPFPLVYISFPSAKDPAWSERYPGKSTVEIVTVTKPAWFDAWRGTTWQQRGADYEAKKQVIAQRLLDILFTRMPQLREALAFHELSTPLSTRFYQRNEQGEIYGLNHNVERFDHPALHPKSPIRNLYFTGADVVTAGVGGAVMGGLMTTAVMLGPRRAREVMGLLESWSPSDSAPL